LKGSLVCWRCKRAGRSGRMILQHVVNSKGTRYAYFFCRNKQSGACDAPHINVLLIEDAVEAHYATIRFSPKLVISARRQDGGRRCG
jgi:site-specific DNA recombinase